jgi:hypothetical protein
MRIKLTMVTRCAFWVVTTGACLLLWYLLVDMVL